MRQISLGERDRDPPDGHELAGHILEAELGSDVIRIVLSSLDHGAFWRRLDSSLGRSVEVAEIDMSAYVVRHAYSMDPIRKGNNGQQKYGHFVSIGLPCSECNNFGEVHIEDAESFAARSRAVSSRD